MRDVWSHELWIANRALDDPVHEPPEIFVVDEFHGTSRTTSLQHEAQTLLAVPLP